MTRKEKAIERNYAHYRRLGIDNPLEQLSSKVKVMSDNTVYLMDREGWRLMGWRINYQPVNEEE